MKSITSIILFFIVLFLLISCGTTKKIEALKPTPTENKPMVYKNKTSFIPLPVEVTLADVQKQINKNLKGLIYEDDNIDDDKVKMKIWKTDAIQLVEKTESSTLKYL